VELKQYIHETVLLFHQFNITVTGKALKEDTVVIIQIVPSYSAFETIYENSEILHVSHDRLTQGQKYGKAVAQATCLEVQMWLNFWGSRRGRQEHLTAGGPLQNGPLRRATILICFEYTRLRSDL
jgi:hypothetical protein